MKVNKAIHSTITECPYNKFLIVWGVRLPITFFDDKSDLRHYLNNPGYPITDRLLALAEALEKDGYD